MLLLKMSTFSSNCNCTKASVRWKFASYNFKKYVSIFVHLWVALRSAEVDWFIVFGLQVQRLVCHWFSLWLTLSNRFSFLVVFAFSTTWCLSKPFHISHSNIISFNRIAWWSIIHALLYTIDDTYDYNSSAVVFFLFWF